MPYERLQDSTSSSRSRPMHDSEAELFRCVYDELYGIACRNFRGQPVGHTLQPTALVNEAYLRLCGQTVGMVDRAHFLRVAARAMRQVLVDHSRRRCAAKRVPRELLVDIDPLLDALANDYEARSRQDLTALDAGLDKLAAAYPNLAELVELHFFGGRTIAECAELLHVSERQAFRWWQTARAFLHREVDS
jgi:RNA polymerase sigma-70 factor (ECF subfamily)